MGSGGTPPANFWHPLPNRRKMASKKTLFVTKTTRRFIHFPEDNVREILNTKGESVSAWKLSEQNFENFPKRGHHGLHLRMLKRVLLLFCHQYNANADFRPLILHRFWPLLKQKTWIGVRVCIPVKNSKFLRRVFSSPLNG